MKKLSDFKENKVELKNVEGGRSFPMMSLDTVNYYLGGPSTPGNYIATVGTDMNGSWTWADYEPGVFAAAPR